MATTSFSSQISMTANSPHYAFYQSLFTNSYSLAMGAQQDPNAMYQQFGTMADPNPWQITISDEAGQVIEWSDSDGKYVAAKKAVEKKDARKEKGQVAWEEIL